MSSPHPSAIPKQGQRTTSTSSTGQSTIYTAVVLAPVPVAVGHSAKRRSREEPLAAHEFDVRDPPRLGRDMATLHRVPAQYTLLRRPLHERTKVVA